MYEFSLMPFWLTNTPAIFQEELFYCKIHVIKQCVPMTPSLVIEFNLMPFGLTNTHAIFQEELESHMENKNKIKKIFKVRHSRL